MIYDPSHTPPPSPSRQTLLNGWIERKKWEPNYAPGIIADRSHGELKISGTTVGSLEEELGRQLYVFKTPQHEEQPIVEWLTMVYDREYLELAYSIHQALVEAERLLGACVPLASLRGSKNPARPASL